MEIYNKINWIQGMEITPQTFIEAEKYHLFMHKINRKLNILPSYGLMPDNKFELECIVQNNNLIISKIDCNFITKEGSLIQLSQGDTISLPTLPSGEYYLTVSIKDLSQVEINNMPYLKINYQFHFQQLIDLNSPSVFPLLKLNNQNEIWTIGNFIPPCIAISSHKILSTYYNQILQSIEKLTVVLKEKNFTLAMTLIFMLYTELLNYSKTEPPLQIIILIKKIFSILKINEVFNCNEMDAYLQTENNANTTCELFQSAITLFQIIIHQLNIIKETAPQIVEKKEDTEKKEVKKDEELFFLL